MRSGALALTLLALLLLAAAHAHAQDDPRGWLFVGDIWLSTRIDPLPIVGYEYDMDAIGQGVGWLEGTAWVTDDWARIVLAAHNTGAFARLREVYAWATWPRVLSTEERLIALDYFSALL